MKIQCGTCMTTVSGTPRGGYETYDEETSLVTRFSLLECPECSAPIVVEQDQDGYRSDGHATFDSPRRLYPQPVKWISHTVPEIVRAAFVEAKMSFQCGAFMASAVMCRRSLEAICVDRGAVGKTLMAQLKDLKGKGAIDPSLSEWADALRITGNEAAHATGIQTSRQDARDALDFTEAIIDYLYIFKARFDAYMKRREGGA